jgi:hypothetical protein
VLKEPTDDDADDRGATSVEHVAPNPTDSNLLGQAHPLVVDQVEATAPSTDGQKRKCPPPALKRKQSKPPSYQVMTQIELPSYMHLRLFEAIQHASQAAGAVTSVEGAAQPAKKTHGSPLKSILVPR